MQLVTAGFLKERVTVVASGCWLWNRRRNRGGYGVTKKKAATYLAHRMSYAVFRGPIPAGVMVCHTCDVPACINPEHLFLGTNADNIRDSIQKGRCRPVLNFGAKASRLSESDVVGIRLAVKQGESRRTVALRYGISKSMVNAIIWGRRLVGIGVSPVGDQP